MSRSRGCASWRRRYSTRGRVLIAERPAGKHMAGWWEFPGGKVGPDESDTQALIRELREELGIDAEPNAEIMTLTHDYPDRVVDLVLWRATVKSGVPRGLDGQQLKWVDCGALARGTPARSGSSVYRRTAVGIIRPRLLDGTTSWPKNSSSPKSS